MSLELSLNVLYCHQIWCDHGWLVKSFTPYGSRLMTRLAKVQTRGIAEVPRKTPGLLLTSLRLKKAREGANCGRFCSPFHVVLRCCQQCPPADSLRFLPELVMVQCSVVYVAYIL